MVSFKTHIEVGNVKSPQCEENANRKEEIHRISEGFEINQWAFAPMKFSRSSQQEDESCVEHDDEAHDSNGPRISDLWRQLSRKNWEDDATNWCTTSCQTQSKSASLRKVSRDKRYAWGEEKPVSDTLDDALAQNEMPVLTNRRRREYGKDLEPAASEEKGPEMAAIHEGSRHRAKEEQEE